MQIRPLFLSVPRAPPPSSGVHCEPRLARRRCCSRCGSVRVAPERAHVNARALATSILIIIYAVARGSDIIIVRTRQIASTKITPATLRAGQTVVEHLYTYRAASIRVRSLYDAPRKRECANERAHVGSPAESRRVSGCNRAARERERARERESERASTLISRCLRVASEAAR